MLHGAQIPAHAFFVLADTGNDANARPAYVNYGYGSALGALRHENGRLGLRCAAAVIIDVRYTQVTSGHSRELDGAMVPNATSSLAESNWCDATEPLSGLVPEGENYGSPGSPNQPCRMPEQSDADSGVISDPIPTSGGIPADNVDSGLIPGQCFDALTGAPRAVIKLECGDLLVSEIMPAPSVGNNGPGEWFEVLATNNVDLNGLELANEGTGSTLLISDTCLSVNAGDWLLFARGADPTQNGGLPAATATFGFTLADSSSSTYAERALILRLDSIELDRATWTSSTKGVSMQRSLSALGSAVSVSSSNWCVTPAAYTFGVGDRGTPGAANAICPSDLADAGLNNSSDAADASPDHTPAVVDASLSDQCRDENGSLRDSVPPQVGDLEITEVMPAPSQGNNGPGEWFEVRANAAIDLNGLEFANEGTGSTLLVNQSCLKVRTGDRLVFARSADPSVNGGLPTVTATFDFTLADSSSTTYAERSVVLRHEGTELNRTSWTKSTRGASWQLSAPELDAMVGRPFTDAGGNLAQWCVTPSNITFGLGDRGTPGTDNIVCP